MSFHPSGSMLKCLVISCFDLDSLVLKHMGLFLGKTSDGLKGLGVEELRSSRFVREFREFFPLPSASDYLARPNCRSRGYELEIGNWML